MKYKIGDQVILKDINFDEYNNKVFVITDVLFEGIYMVKKDGFDPIWVTEENFA